MTPTIIVIGAGASGLKAAKLLSKKFKVVILEASDRLGGRINTIKNDKFSTPVEGGAEFIHGDLKATMKLLKKAGVDYEKFGGDICRVHNGEWKLMDEGFEGWDKLLTAMKKAKKDMPLSAFLEKRFPGEEFEALRKQATEFAEGFNLADSHIAGIKGLHVEWGSQEAQNYCIPDGYISLINYLADECRKNGVEIITNCCVEQVDWKEGEVQVRSRDGKLFSGSKLIITVSAGILQRTIGPCTIRFNPIPEEHLHAYRMIGFGPVIKFIVQFRKPIWSSFQKNISFILSEEQIPTWWTRTINDNHYLVGWKGGPQVLSIGDKDDESLLQLAYQSLTSIFRINMEELKEQVVHAEVRNWFRNDFSEGGYSFPLVETKAAREILSRPVEDTIYFAGEGVFEGKQAGTVEAALLSGRAVARRIRAKK